MEEADTQFVEFATGQMSLEADDDDDDDVCESDDEKGPLSPALSVNS